MPGSSSWRLGTIRTEVEGRRARGIASRPDGLGTRAGIGNSVLTILIGTNVFINNFNYLTGLWTLALDLL